MIAVLVGIQSPTGEVVQQQVTLPWTWSYVEGRRGYEVYVAPVDGGRGLLELSAGPAHDGHPRARRSQVQELEPGVVGRASVRWRGGVLTAEVLLPAPP